MIYIDPVDEYTAQSSGQQLAGRIDVKNLNIPFSVDTNLETSDTGLFDGSVDRLNFLYPASLSNMQSRLRKTLTSNNRRFLPSWMTSKQPDNRVLNYVAAVPLVYMKPGTGRRALFKLQQVFEPIQTQALVDRYLWDDGLAINYDKNLNQYVPNVFTTFDTEEFSQSQFDVQATVDFAVTVPFYQINNVTAASLRASGVIDGYRGDLNGKTLVFYQQENYANISDFQNINGWAQVVPQFDDPTFGDNFETYNVVTGQTELATTPITWAPFVARSINDVVSYNGVIYMCVTAHDNSYPIFPRDFYAPLTSDSQYQRAGVWRMTEESSGVITLEFVKEIVYSASAPFASVKVQLGVTFGGSLITLVPAAQLGVTYTVPGYINQDALILDLDGTVFDASTTEFFDKNTDSYLEADQGDKYIVFNKQTILDRGTVDV